MTKKQIFRYIAFLLAVCITLVVLCDLFEQENHNSCDRSFYLYRTYPKDTVDAVYIGTSGVDNYWISSQAYEEYGMTVHPLSTEGMPAWLYRNLIDEALTYQTPELILLDIRGFTQDVDPTEEFEFMTLDARIRRVLDAMDFFSLNRIRTAFRAMEVVHSLDPSAPRWDISYLFSFVKYHSKWSDREYRLSSNIGQRTHKYGGFNANDVFSTAMIPQTPFPYDPDITQELDPLCEQSLREILAYAGERNLQILFVDSPVFLDEGRNGRTNQVYRILEEAGMDYVGFYDASSETGFSIGLDPETDFHDAAHVNFFGAQKYTRALSEYLDVHYDLPDRRTDPQAQDCWDGVNDRLNEFIASLPLKDSKG